MLALDRSHSAGVVMAQDDDFDVGPDDFEEDEELSKENEGKDTDTDYEDFDDYADEWDDEPKRGGRSSGDDWD